MNIREALERLGQPKRHTGPALEGTVTRIYGTKGHIDQIIFKEKDSRDLILAMSGKEHILSPSFRVGSSVSIPPAIGEPFSTLTREEKKKYFHVLPGEGRGGTPTILVPLRAIPGGR